MKEFTSYWCSGRSEGGVFQARFFAEPESQFVVTNIIAKSDEDNLVIRKSYNQILGLPSIVTTKEIEDGDTTVEVSSYVGAMGGNSLQVGRDVTIQGSIPYFGFSGNIIAVTPGSMTITLNQTYSGPTIAIGAVIYVYDDSCNIPMISDGQSGYELNIQGDGLACSVVKNGLLVQCYGSNTSLFVSGYYDDIS